MRRNSDATGAAARLSLLTVSLSDEHDVVLARHRTRQLAELIGFDAQDQTRLATAVSELARNAFQYAGGGRVELALDGAPLDTRALVVRVVDRGPGIPHLDTVLGGDYVSSTGMGVGLVGAKRLTDHFHVETGPTGTLVEVAKTLPPRARHLDGRAVARLTEALARLSPASPFEEMRRQNQELVRALEALQQRQLEVERLNQELEETNRGVLALYAELDDRAEDLRRASTTKSQFLSHMSHELRAPLTSVLNVARLLYDRTDGDLTPEQERQVLMIRRSVEGVIEMIGDLLDLAKIEAGKTTLRAGAFTTAELFAALRGMFRPLLTRDAVTLVFDERTDLPPLATDEGKLSQILRNFISNAIKFTIEGEIRVTVEPLPGDQLRFAVADTGIGIPPEDQARIFEEFTQVEGPLHRQVRGTGLGLALTRKLAELLGGYVELESAPGQGSTFAVVLPRVLADVSAPVDGAGASEVRSHG